MKMTWWKENEFDISIIERYVSKKIQVQNLGFTPNHDSIICNFKVKIPYLNKVTKKCCSWNNNNNNP
jgi:hypothetical protein